MRLDQTDFQMYLLKNESENVHSVHILKFIGLSNIRFWKISIIFIIYQIFCSEGGNQLAVFYFSSCSSSSMCKELCNTFRSSNRNKY